MERIDVKDLDFFACPRSFPKKCKTRLDAWVAYKAIYRDHATQFLPSIMSCQIGNDPVKRFTVERIVWLYFFHGADKDIY